MKNKPVYNLIFPVFVNELNIGGYKFSRIPEYDQAFCGLQHLVESHGAEHQTKIQDGMHQRTATVEIPDSEKLAVLGWADKNTTRLADVTLLLSIFTGRSVFVDMDEDGGVKVFQDHRRYSPFGGEIILSLPRIPMCREVNTGLVGDRSLMEGKPGWKYERFDMGLEKGLNAVLALVSSDQWLKEYQNGYFLFLFKQALHRQVIESSFILFWSIWEHLFALYNSSWMDLKTIEKLSGKEKIKFVYDHYLKNTAQVFADPEIDQLKKTRNRIVHFGKMKSSEDVYAMERFIRMTERLVAIILGLNPSFKLEGAENTRKMTKT